MRNRSSKAPAEILLVEDNPGDVLLVEEALAETSIGARLSVARDGEQAYKFLHREGAFADASRPDLILLDLNLPRRDGRELLGLIKADPSLRRIPVIVLTTSRSEQDIVRTYELHANSYVIKPVGIEALNDVVRGIYEFWFRITTLPPPVVNDPPV